jgi:hypothetical protein
LSILQIIDLKINTSHASLQTKGKFACPVCGLDMKSHYSITLGKEVFDEYVNFISKNHRYWTTKNIFSMGKKRLD